MARYALDRGLVELADGEGPLERDPSRVLRIIRLAPPGRTCLDLRAAAPLGGREPLAVLREAVALFLGDDVEVDAGPTGAFLAQMDHVSDGDTWEARVVAAARHATDQGVPCAPVIYNPRGYDFVLEGFEAVEPPIEGGPR